jgi:hypothetical protein
MHVLVESGRLQEEPDRVAGDAVVPHPKSGTAGFAGSDPDSGLIYDLRLKESDSSGFYADVSEFSDKMLAEKELRAGAAFGDYSRYVQDELREAPSSLGEYSFELLTFGQALRRYGSAAESTPAWVVELARRLFTLRRRWAGGKPIADLLRATVARLYLVPRIGCGATAKLHTPGDCCS